MVKSGLGTRAALERRADAAIVAAVGYFLLATMAIHLTAHGHDHATIWPADAVILVLLLREPRDNWGWILAAGWCANLAANAVARGWSPVLVAYGAVNMGQTALAAWLTLRHLAGSDTFGSNRAIWRFIFYAGGAAVAAGALVGSAISWAAFGEPYWQSVARWYFSNALGFLVLTPFFAALIDGSYLKWLRFADRREALAALLGYGALIAASAGVFVQGFMPLLFLPVCLVTYLSFRLGRLGTKLGVMLVAVVGTAATLAGLGPVAQMPVSAELKALFLQLYLGTLLVTCLPIAAIVTSRRKMMIRLAEREEALRQILESTPNGCLGFDHAGQCKWSAGPIRALLGFAPDDLIGRSCESVSLQVHDIVQDLFARYRTGLVEENIGTRVVEFSPVRRPHLTLEGTIGILCHAGGLGGVVITLRDVTARRASDLAMLGRSETDELTGLCSRESFLGHLQRAFEDIGRPVSLALIDLDSFYTINEEHGRVTGDAVLVEVARRIKRTARDTDVVSRFGADHFALLLRCDILTARGICERIAEAIRQNPVCTSEAVAVLSSLSCGVVQLRAGMSVDEALSIAGSALEDMKQSGRNGVRVAA